MFVSDEGNVLTTDAAFFADGGVESLNPTWTLSVVLLALAPQCNHRMWEKA